MKRWGSAEQNAAMCASFLIGQITTFFESVLSCLRSMASPYIISAQVGSRLVLKVEMRFLRRLIHIDSEPNRGASPGSLQCDVFEYLTGK